MKRMAILTTILVLSAVGCGGRGWPGWEFDLRPEDDCRLTGTWSGYIGDVVSGKVQIAQEGTNLLIVDDAGYYAEGLYEAGWIELTDCFGNEMRGHLFMCDEIRLAGPDGATFALLRKLPK